MDNFKKELEKLMENEVVYVGTDDGSAWIVIETAGTLLKKMDLLNEKVREITTDRIEYCKDCLRRIPKRIERTEAELSETQKMHPEEFLKRWQKADGEELKQKRIEVLKKQIQKLKIEFDSKIDKLELEEIYLSRYVPVAERKVVEKYTHKSDVKGLCFILEGNEKGDLWLYGEKKSILC